MCAAVAAEQNLLLILPSFLTTENKKTNTIVFLLSFLEHAQLTLFFSSNLSFYVSIISLFSFFLLLFQIIQINDKEKQIKSKLSNQDSVEIGASFISNQV